jgi:hypothetical protein
MKEKISLEITNANQGQLKSLHAELRILSRQWKHFGPIITINGKSAGDDTSLRLQASSTKQIGKKWSRNLSRW